MKWKYGVSAIVATVTSFALVTPSYAAFQSQQMVPKLERAVPVSGIQMCLDSDGDIFVLARNGKVIELSSAGQVERTFNTRAKAITVSPDGSTLYAVEKIQDGSGIAILQTSTGDLVNTIVSSRMSDPSYLTISPDGQQLYVYNQSSPLMTGYNHVFWLSTATGAVEGGSKIPTSGNVAYSTPSTMTVSQGGNSIWVPWDQGGNYVENSTSDYSGLQNIDIPTSSSTMWHLRNSTNITDVTEGPEGTLYATDSGSEYFGSGYVYALNPQTESVEYTWHITAAAPYFVARGINQLFVVIGARDLSTNIVLINIASKKLDGSIRNQDFGVIHQVVYSPSSETLDVLSNEGLFLYSLPSSPPPPPPSSVSVSQTNEYSLEAGWNLVDAAIVNDIEPVKSEFWNGYAYVPNAPSPGNAEWIDTSHNSTVSIPPPSLSSYSITVAAQTWGMIGNPYTTPVAITLQPGDKADTYAQGSGYTIDLGTTLVLLPGQGAWLFSAAGGSYTVAPSNSPTTGTQPPSMPAS